MKKTLTIVLTVTAMLMAGGAVIGWSVHQKRQAGLQLSNLKDFTDETFEKEVVQASEAKPVLVDFYADWCFPCRLLDPTLKELARDMEGRAVIGRIDYDRNLIVRRLGITQIPTIFIIRNGEVKSRFLGVTPKAELIKALREHGA